MAWSAAARAAAALARRGKATGSVEIGPVKVPRSQYAALLRQARAKWRGKKSFAQSSKNRLAREAVHKKFTAKFSDRQGRSTSGQSAEVSYAIRRDRGGG